MSVYLCISIDCECDKGPGWRTRRPLSFDGVTTGMRDRLQPLFRRHHAKPTYLLSAEIMRDERALDSVRSLEGNAELGTHLHGEFAEPGAFEPTITSAFQCNYDRETERRKLQYLTELFRGTIGEPPRSFRAGRFGIGRNSLGLLQDLGYSVDSSVTPGVDWRRAGAPEASFRSAPTQPYWPVMDRPDCAAPSRGDLLEIPVTIRPSIMSRIPLAGHWAQPRWLRPTRCSLSQLIEIATDEIECARDPNRPVVLNCMFHNVEVVPGTSPYARNESEARAILNRLGGLLAFAESAGFRTIGLGDVPELFDSQPPPPIQAR